MAIRMRLPLLEAEPEVGRTCERCGKGRVRIHGREVAAVRDLRAETVHKVRVLCPACTRTYTVVPRGLRRGWKRSDRVVAAGVVLYCLGLSYEKVAAFIRSWVGSASASRVYDDVQRAGAQAKRMHERHAGVRVRILGIDGTGQKLKGGSCGVVLGVDAERGVLLEAQLLEEDNEQELKRFLAYLCRTFGVEIVVSDEHQSYRKAAGEVGADHRLCSAHWLKSKKLRILKARAEAKRRRWNRYIAHLDELSRLIEERTDQALERLREIHQCYLHYRWPRRGETQSLGSQMRLLTVHLLETWRNLPPDGTLTNNATERAIGTLLKCRSKLMRGFKRKENIIPFIYLSDYLWSNRSDCQLQPIC